MLRTQLIVSFWFDGLPTVDWWQPWNTLAEQVEHLVQPNPKKGEIIWWTLTPASSLALADIVVGGEVELCTEIRLPKAAGATLSQSMLYGLKSMSPTTVKVTIEVSASGEVLIQRPEAATIEAAATLIAKSLR